MEQVKLNLSPTQIKKLMKGGAIQLKPEDLVGDIVLQVLKGNSKKIASARKARRGMRLSLEQPEIEGSGLKEIIETVKKGYAGYKKNVKPIVGPVIRKGLKGASKAGIAALVAAQPELLPLAPELSRAADQLVDLVGDKTGSYGMRKGRGVMSQGERAPLPPQPVVNVPIGAALCGCTHMCGSSFRALGAGTEGGSFSAVGVKRRGRPKKSK